MAISGKLVELERVEVETRKQWRHWLTLHHASSPGVWLVTFKAATGKPRPTYDETVEEALCFGWIDSKPQKLDEARTMLLFTPRNPKSLWSAKNKRHIDAMLVAGKMQPAGLKMVALAKASGTWTALDQVEQLLVPEDLAVALDTYPSARAYWDAFPPSARRGILEWIVTAKRPETRAKRIAETARLAAENRRANQWR